MFIGIFRNIINSHKKIIIKIYGLNNDFLNLRYVTYIGK